MTQKTPTVGVIVGRFQVHELHEAHINLIDKVRDQHDKVIIFLGLSPLMVTRENPLDFEARKQMILDDYPEIIVGYIKDKASDEVWSKELDRLIGDLVTPSQVPHLYGGRDSFIAHYKGRHETHELAPETYVRFSGTEVRRSIASKSTKGSPDFRAGVIWAALGGFPTCYPTVDVAVLNEDETEVLLAKKPGEDKWRFIGGFADPRSPTYEADARREVGEEAHIEITDPKYIGSFMVDDWRYRNEVDKIKTLFFVAKHFSGAPKPDDDIEELRWFKRCRLNIGQVVYSHHPLLVALYEHKRNVVIQSDTDRNES